MELQSGLEPIEPRSEFKVDRGRRLLHFVIGTAALSSEASIFDTEIEPSLTTSNPASKPYNHWLSTNQTSQSNSPSKIQYGRSQSRSLQGNY
ncbi:MAG: hypothetical protein CL912_08670 [Deltaproteobacteria bacterium]|nr:hypothetical protein [Deltaproteobacteria bacterium]